LEIEMIHWTTKDRDNFIGAIKSMGGLISHYNYRNYNVHLGNICISFEEPSGRVYLTNTNSQEKRWLDDGFREWMYEIMKGY
jgi:hypothetical protein